MSELDEHIWNERKREKKKKKKRNVWKNFTVNAAAISDTKD